jgi:Zn-dependent alcohol dehydrogenase
MVQRARALVAPAKGSPLELQDVILEAPRPDEALVEIHATGVCHGDLACLTGKVPVPFPIVLGHEGIFLTPPCLSFRNGIPDSCSMSR